MKMLTLDFSHIGVLFEVETCTSYGLEFQDDLSAGEAARLFPGIFSQVSTRSGILNVRNYIGSFDFLGKRVKVIAAKKLSEADFEVMLAELIEKLAQLPFTFNTPALTSVTSMEMESADILYHSFLIIRHFIYEGEPTLEEAMTAIIHDPSCKMKKEPKKFDIWRVSHITGSSLQRLLYRQQDWVQLPGNHQMLQTTVSARLEECGYGGYFPQTLVQDRIVRNFDTVENRFVKGVLKLCMEVLELFKEGIKWKKGVLQKQVLSQQCNEMLELLGHLLYQSFLAEVGEMTMIPYQSNVLQKRDGYRNMLIFYHRLLGGLHLAIDPESLTLLIEQKDIAELYELWTFVRMIDFVSEAVGTAPLQALRIHKDDWQANAAHGLEVRYLWQGQTLKLWYNRTFRKGGESYSLTLRPDIVLEFGERRYIFDAKFKLQYIQWETEEEDEQLERSSSTFKNGDIYKMHTYKDAIHGVISACILYPNAFTSEIKFFPEQPGNLVGVGAIPLLPGRDGAKLVAFIRDYCLV